MAQFTPESPKIFAASSPIELAQSQETTWCQRCGAARCRNSLHGRVLQPHPVGTHRFAEQNMATPIEGCDMSPEDPLKFYRFLQMIGLALLAEAWISQVRAGIAPENIIFQSSQINLQERVVTATPSIPNVDTESLGAESEAQLLRVLADRTVFPWIKRVNPARLKQPGYDAQLKLNLGHPIGSMLGKVKGIKSSGVVKADAKSSYLGVFTYYEEAARRNNKHAKADRVRDGFWAINTNKDLNPEQLYAQMVILLLITIGYFNQEGHWLRVLSNLDKRIVDSFQSQTQILEDYRYFFFKK